MSRNAFILGIFLIAVWYFMQPKRVIRLSQNSSNRDFERVTDAAKARPDLSFINNEERAKICRPYFFMNNNPDRMMKDNYDWTAARVALGCDNSAEDAGFPPSGTLYWI